MKNGKYDEGFRTAWYLNGKLHRDGEPAVEESSGGKSYWNTGLMHREDGPAHINLFGYKYWWINEIHFSEEEFNRLNEWLNTKSI